MEYMYVPNFAQISTTMVPYMFAKLNFERLNIICTQNCRTLWKRLPVHINSPVFAAHFQSIPSCAMCNFQAYPLITWPQ